MARAHRSAWLGTWTCESLWVAATSSCSRSVVRRVRQKKMRGAETSPLQPSAPSQPERAESSLPLVNETTQRPSNLRWLRCGRRSKLLHYLLGWGCRPKNICTKNIPRCSARILPLLHLPVPLLAVDSNRQRWRGRQPFLAGSPPLSLVPGPTQQRTQTTHNRPTSARSSRKQGRRRPRLDSERKPGTAVSQASLYGRG